MDRVKGIFRKAVGYKPKNVLTGDEYDKLEETYRKVRDEFSFLQASVTKLKDYEHDGTTYKLIKESLEKVKGRQEVENEDLIDNMYKVMNTTLINLSNAYPDDEQKQMTKKLIETNKLVSDKKHEMNRKLESIIVYLKQMKNMSIKINEARTIMKNLQYDADNAITKEKKKNPNADAENVPEIKRKLTEYKEKFEETKSSMKEYLNHENHRKVLTGLTEINAEYYKDVAAKIK